MNRYCTDTFIIELPFSVSTLDECILSFAQDDETILEKTMEEMVTSGNTLTVTLTEEETALFEEGNALYQVNALFKNGTRKGSEKEKFKVVDNLHKEVMRKDADEIQD